MKKIKGIIWMIRLVGIRHYLKYEKWRREGKKIDYSRFLSPEEFKILEEHNLWPIKR